MKMIIWICVGVAGLLIIVLFTVGVLKKMKKKKAPGPDGIRIELLKIMDEEGLEIIISLIN